MLKRIVIIIIGLALISSVVYLGWLASTTPTLVIWFGVAAAILAPAGFAFIGFALRSGENELLQKLSKVPELQQLIEKAQNQEEKIKALENEREHLEEVVKFEALRSSLLERQSTLENQGVKLLEALYSVEEQLKSIEVEVESRPDREIIEKLRERIQSSQRGDILIEFGTTSFAINTNKLRELPGGDILIVYARVISDILNAIKKVQKALLTRRSS